MILVFTNDGNLLPPCRVPMYLGVKLDRSLTFHHLEALCKKLSTTVALLKQLAGSGWGAGAKTLCTSALPRSTALLSAVHQFGVVVCMLASLTIFSMMLCAVSLDACILHQQRTHQSSKASSQLSSADKGDTLFGKSCYP